MKAKKLASYLIACCFVLLFLAGLAPQPLPAQDIQVNSADPPSAPQGTVNLNVSIKGKGFKNGAAAKFFVTSTTDPGGVRVNSTTFKGPTELVANIDVADNATIAQFDVEVQNTDGRTGKGIKLFSVTGKGGGQQSCPTPTPALTTVVSCSFMAAGCLDTSFGVGGVVIQNTSAGTSVQTDIDIAKAVAIQADGKIVVAGQSHNAAGVIETAILRLNLDGSLDPVFGNGGQARLAMSGVNGVTDAAVQPDGKLLLGGFGFAVVRLNSDGSLDTSFGSNGVASTTFQAKNKRTGGLAYALKLQPDGKILVAGDSVNGKWGLARFTSNGSLDSSFGIGGQLEATAGRAYAIAFQTVTVGGLPVDRILVGGYSGGNFAVMRFTMSGAVDVSFGPAGDGRVVKDFCGNFDLVRGMGVDPAGNIVAGGMAALGTLADGLPNYNFGLARFTPNGLPDTAFGEGVSQRPGTSMVEVLGGSDSVWGFGIQPDGKIIVSGRAQTGGLGSPSYVALARFNPNGTLDVTFGPGGVVATDASSEAGGNFGHKLALQGDGKIVVVGSTAAFGSYNFLVVRYWQ